MGHPRRKRVADRAAADPCLLARSQIPNPTTDAGDLDIANHPDGTGGYEDLQRSAHTQTLGGGRQIAIASLEDIIRSKTPTGRAKDLATLTSYARH